MSIASAIATKQQQVADSYTAVSNKGGTLPATQNLTNLATAISSIPSGTTPTGTLSITANGVYDVTNYASADVSVSGGGGGGKYSLLQRISDDSNNEIGTVSGFFTDGNDIEYAVVCLDAQYRTDSGMWASSYGIVTNLPLYTDATIWTSTETATTNTTLILASKVSTGCSHCRNQSFTIDGTVYYGQLPNIIELVDIFRHRIEINTADTSAGSYPNLIIHTNKDTWASNQTGWTEAWRIRQNGTVYVYNKDTNNFIIPVLEIPNN